MRGKRISIPEPSLIDDQAQLDAVCAACRAEGRFSFDTEFVMEDRFKPEVCLIQIATADAVVIVDPFLRLSLDPVWALVCDARVETVVHAGQEDLALCVQHTGEVPRNVFDVQVAAGFVGFDYPLSLQKLVQGTWHVRLHKTKTLTDWRRRPLAPAQITYAADDVAYLLAIRQLLGERLERLGRTQWVQEELSRFEDMSIYRRAAEDKLMRIKGAGSLQGKHLAILSELMDWRDAFAERVNRPPRVVLKDHLLVEIARHGMTSPEDVRQLRGLNLSRRDTQGVVDVVKRAQTIPAAQWPEAKPRDVETPQETALLSLATAVVRTYCLENDLAYGLVAAQKSIRQLIGHLGQEPPADRAQVELLNGWRGRSVGITLEEVLTGKRTVRVELSGNGRAVHVSPPNGGTSEASAEGGG